MEAEDSTPFCELLLPSQPAWFEVRTFYERSNFRFFGTMSPMLRAGH